MATAKSAATNRGKAALAKGPPPFGGPKGKGKLATPAVAGPKAGKPPILGKVSGLRGKQK